jgi:hypothetical protein
MTSSDVAGASSAAAMAAGGISEVQLLERKVPSRQVRWIEIEERR